MKKILIALTAAALGFASFSSAEVVATTTVTSPAGTRVVRTIQQTPTPMQQGQMQRGQRHEWRQHRNRCQRTTHVRRNGERIVRITCSNGRGPANAPRR